MRSLKTALFAIVAVVALLTSTASLAAQTYDGPSSDEVAISAASPTAGGPVGFSAAGLDAGAVLRVSIDCGGAISSLGSLTVAADGTVSESLAIPSGATGTCTIGVVDAAGGLVGSLPVSVAAAACLLYTSDAADE